MSSPFEQPVRFRWVWLMPLMLAATTTLGAEIKLLKSRPDDTYGVPRPAFDQRAVPLKTTFYFELAVTGGADDDVVLAESVEVRLLPTGRAASLVLGKDVQFAPLYHGFLQPGVDRKNGQKVVVYVDSTRKLLPATNYAIRVSARSRDGAKLAAVAGTWRFTTRGGSGVYPVDFALELGDTTVRWQGGFFTGVCGVTFGGNQASRMSTYELMEQVRQTSPRAWSLLAEAISAVGRIKLPKAYPADAVREVERLSRLRETGSARHTIGATGRLELQARVAAGGVNFLTITLEE